MEIDKKTLEDKLKTRFIILFEDEIMNIPNDSSLGLYVRQKMEKNSTTEVDKIKIN